MATARPRPLSPHMSIWRWRVHMLVSILHRVTGHGNALVGVPLFCWWLVAAASGEEAYNDFYALARSPFGYIVGIGLTLNFFQHMMSGVRHLVMDTGAAYEIRTAKKTSMATFAGSILLTALVWGAIYLHKGF
jgi:succinate dehydrogenase / fumarate reductase cytochrome b subunit